MKKIIFHIDADAFFASCEEILNIELKNVPFAVAGERKKAIISSCNYIARKYGVKAAMNTSEAKLLCPNIVFVNPHHNFYSKISNLFFESLIYNYTNEVEIYSIDECFVDVTKILDKFHNNPILLAIDIQKFLLNKIGLSVSIGISTNKFLAKMATDFNKPKGISTLWVHEIPEKLDPLNIREIIGIGKSTIPKLEKQGINTIKDMKKSENQDFLKDIFINQYQSIISKINGMSDDMVDTRTQFPKSIGKSLTLSYSETELETILKIFQDVSIQLEEELGHYKMFSRNLTVMIKYSDFSTKTKSKTISTKIIHHNQIFELARDLFFEIWNESEVRLIGISLAKLDFI